MMMYRNLSKRTLVVTLIFVLFSFGRSFIAASLSRSRILSKRFSQLSVDALGELTVAQLKERLRERGLGVTGVKKELIERLLSSDKPGSGTDTNPEKKVKKLSLLSKKSKLSKKDLSPADEDSKDDETHTEPTKASITKTMKGEVSTPTTVDRSSSSSSTKESKKVAVRSEVERNESNDDDDFLAQLMMEGEEFMQEKPQSVRWDVDPREFSRQSSKPRMSSSSSAAVVGSEKDIQDLVNDREDARRRRDFDTADAIREQLRQLYRVELYDKRGEWEAADGRKGPLKGRVLPKSIPVEQVPCKYTYDEVMELVRERTLMRRSRMFEEADRIRDDLAKNGVELYDQTNEWRSWDGKLEGEQSDDQMTYEVAKDRARRVRSSISNRRDDY